MFASDGWINKGIRVTQTQDVTAIPQLRSNVNEFVNDMMDYNSRQSLFKILLDQRIKQGARLIEKQKINAMWQDFPFLFGPANLPKQMKYLIFATKNKIPLSKITPKDVQNVDSQTFDNSVYQGIYESLAYGQPYLIHAYSQYLKLRDFVRNNDPAQLQRAQIQLDNQQRVGGIANRIWNVISRPMALLWSGIQKLDASLFMNAVAGSYFIDTIRKAKVYGEAVINCAYLEKNGIRQQRNGIYLIIDPTCHILRFQIANGFLTIYIDDNGTLKQIMPAQFTAQYLRTLMRSIYTKRSGGVLKTYNSFINPEKQNITRKSEFQTYFYHPRKFFRDATKPYKIIKKAKR